MNRNLVVVFVNGVPQCGKDTVIEQAIKYINNLEDTTCNYYAENWSAIDREKKMLMELGWDGKEKTQEVRDMLSKMQEFSIQAGQSIAERMASYVLDQANHRFYGSSNYNTLFYFMVCRKKAAIDCAHIALKMADKESSHEIMSYRLYVKPPVIDYDKLTNEGDSDAAHYTGYDYIIENDCEDLKKLYDNVVKFIDKIRRDINERE